MPRQQLFFEGLSEDEILSLPNDAVEQLILLGEPIVFRAGSAEVLGSFRVTCDRLVVELAQIEGAGEGVLVSISSWPEDTLSCADFPGSSGLCMPYRVQNRILSFEAFVNVEILASNKSQGWAKPIT